MPQTHEYPISVEWRGGRSGKGRVSASQSGTSLEIAVPPEFQGPGGGASPEELLASAVASCYAITLGIIADNRKLPIVDLKADVVGEVEQNGPSFKYTAITIKPTITLAADATDEHAAMAEDMAHKADSYCIITNAVRASLAIRVEPTIRRA